MLYSIGLDVGSSRTKVAYRENLLERDVKFISFKDFYKTDKKEDFSAFVSDGLDFSTFTLPTHLVEKGGKCFLPEIYPNDLKEYTYSLKDMDDDHLIYPEMYTAFLTLLMNYVEKQLGGSTKNKFVYTLGCARATRRCRYDFKKYLEIAYELKDNVENASISLDMIKSLLKTDEKENKSTISQHREQNDEKLEVLPEIIGEALASLKYPSEKNDESRKIGSTIPAAGLYYIFDAGNSTMDFASIIIDEQFDDRAVPGVISVIYEKMDDYHNKKDHNEYVKNVLNDNLKKLRDKTCGSREVLGRASRNDWNKKFLGVYGGNADFYAKAIEDSPYVQNHQGRNGLDESDMLTELDFISKSRFYVAIGLTYGAKVENRPQLYILNPNGEKD